MTEQERLEEAKRLYTTANADQKYVLESLFPQLRASKDERIRKALIDFFNKGAENGEQTNGVCDEDILAWLEKQGNKRAYVEQAMKEVEAKAKAFTAAHQGENADVMLAEMRGEEWSEEDESGLGDALWAIKQARSIAKDENDMGNLWYAERWLKSLKDKVKSLSKSKEWSEEDKKMYQYVVDDLKFVKELDNDHNYAVSVEMVEKEIDWMESLKERYTWKPSDEQMRALHDMNLTGNISYAGQGQTLIELYNDLKKLKEE